jgi:hypothetical protein
VLIGDLTIVLVLAAIVVPSLHVIVPVELPIPVALAVRLTEVPAQIAGLLGVIASVGIMPSSTIIGQQLLAPQPPVPEAV